VWVQAPPHVVENLRAEEKAASGAANKGRKKTVKKKPPERGYAHWNEDTFRRMVDGAPEPLRSSFQVTHQMVMELLDRPAIDGADGCAAVKRLMVDNHETRQRQRGHIRRAIAVYRSLVDAGILEFPPEPDDLGRRVRVTVDLQDDFALHQPLSLWALEAVEQLPAPAVGHGTDDDVGHALDVLTVVESVQESPGVVLAAQVRRARDELMAEMKAAGVEYEERMERLAQVEHPKPNREWIYASFDEFRARHPWVGSDNVQPKSVAREMFERAMTFGEYVHDYGLKRSEGALLRYLSDVYKGMIQNVPAGARTEAVDDVIAWLGALVRQVDSSLIDEWERLVHPDEVVEGEVDPAVVRPPGAEERTILDDERGFVVMVRNRAFDWVQRLARRSGYDELVDGSPTFASVDDVERAMAPYWDEFDEILLDAGARSGERFAFDRATGTVTQILHDPDETNEWRFTATADLDASVAEGRPVLRLRSLGPA
jgi:hypothetical protein